jgi:hypothetical protein
MGHEVDLARMVRGEVVLPEFDQRHQRVDRQYNIVNPEPDPAVLIQRGIAQVRAASYKLAADNLRKALSIDPSIRRTYYYLPVALLRGRRPRVLVEPEIREIDELLAAAMAMNDDDGLFKWFRALLRDDYYNSNRLICPAPEVNELVAAAAAATTDRGELRTLLQDVAMPDNRLHSQLLRLAGSGAPG